MKEIGERLREFRQSKKMKQVDMSKVLGISVSAYSKINAFIFAIKPLLRYYR
jgi:transcriptional regulator with XRE-family HTH domain